MSSGVAIAVPSLCSTAIRIVEHPEQIAVEQILERVQREGLNCFLHPWCCGPSWMAHPDCYLDVSHSSPRVIKPASLEHVSVENCQEVSPEEAADRLFRNIFDPALPIRKILEFNPVSATLTISIAAANAARHPLPTDVSSSLRERVSLSAGAYRKEDVEDAGWLRWDEAAARPLWALVPVGDDGSKVADAITFDRTVIVGSDFLSSTGSDRLALWAHEVTHVSQYRRAGIDAFLLNYIGSGDPEPYCQIEAEKAAYTVERSFRAAFGNSNGTACDRGVPPPARVFALAASQVSEKTSTGIPYLNVSANCGTNAVYGYLCNDNKNAPARAVYDLRRSGIQLPPGTYSLEIEYSSPERIPAVAILSNGVRQSIDFPATGGTGMNARRAVWTNVTFLGGSADLIIERGGLLPHLRGIVLRRIW
jgi:hypothetical protein